MITSRRIGKRTAARIRSTETHRAAQLKFARSLVHRYPSVATVIPQLEKLWRKAVARESRRKARSA